MSVSSSTTLRCADRRSLRFVSSANQRQVHPAGARGGEVQVEPRVLKQPLVDRGRLVGGVVVQHQVQFQAVGDGGVDQLEEPQELLVAVAPVRLGDDRAAGQVKRGEQAGRAVADVVVRHPGRGRRQHRQARRGPVQGLDLRLLV
jgi:hypothetical protein